MDWKRRLEIICGLVAAVLGIIITLEALYITQLAGQMLHESAPMLSTFLLYLALYILPTCLVAIGAYAHAAKKQLWGRALLITATLFLTVWFFLSLVVLVWSGRVLSSLLEVVFAISTSIISLVVRGER